MAWRVAAALSVLLSTVMLPASGAGQDVVEMDRHRIQELGPHLASVAVEGGEVVLALTERQPGESVDVTGFRGNVVIMHGAARKAAAPLIASGPSRLSARTALTITADMKVVVTLRPPSSAPAKVAFIVSEARSVRRN